MCAGGQASPSSSAKETATASQALSLARTCNNDVKELELRLKGDQASTKELATRLEAMASQLEAIEKASTSRSPTAPQSMESTLLPGQQAAGKTPQLEAKVEELRQQVAEELQQLAEHQRVIVKAGASAGVSRGSNLETQDLERSVERLASQVADELRELRDHQGELNKVRSMQGDSGKADSVEPRVKELQTQVAAELAALTKQQEELGKTKVTVADLTKEVRGCQKATANLEDRVSKLDPKASSSKPSSEVPALASLTSATGKRSVTMVSPAAADSSDESYGNDDFDESVEEVSVSGGR